MSVSNLNVLEQYRTNRSRTVTFGPVFGCFVPLLAVTLFPVIHATIPPLVDYINHLARIYVIAFGDRDPLLAQFYAIEWRMIPNLAMDILVPPLAGIAGIYTAGKLFLLASMTLIAAGPHAIHYALFRRWSFAPLIALLFVYNRILSWGLTNYLFGLGLALWGIAAWIALRRANTTLRALVSAAFVLALYFCHLSAVGIYAATLFSIEITAAYRAGATYRWPSNLAAFVIPFLLVPILVVFEPHGDVATQTISWSAFAKLQGILWVFESERLFPFADSIVFALIITGAGAWAWRRRILHIHPAGWIVILVATLAFFIAPTHVMGASGADSRLPIAFLFVVIGFLEWDFTTKRRQLAFLLTLTLLLAARIGIVEYAWGEQATSVAEMKKSLALIRPGSKILVARTDNPKGRKIERQTFLACEAMIERSSLVSLAFSDPRQQILKVKPPFRAMTGGYDDNPPPLSEIISPPHRSTASPSGRIYWANWPKNYDYLYVLSTSGEPNPLPARLTKIYEAHHFQLYAINKSLAEEWSGLPTAWMLERSLPQ